MAWIELHQAVWTHRKTLIFAAELKLNQLYAAAHVIHLWTWALDNAPEGDLSGLPPAVIAFGSGWQGDPEEFLRAIIKSGWIDQNGEILFIHDWDEYAGRLIEKRRLDAERKRQLRGSKKYIPRTSSGQGADGPRDGAGTVPNLTIPNHTNIENTPAPDGAVDLDDPAAEEVAETGEKTVSDYTPEFERFWQLYPRQDEKRAAFKKWKARLKDKKDRASTEDLIAAAKNYAAHVTDCKTELQYIKLAKTFLGDSKPYEEWIKPKVETLAAGPVQYEALGVRRRGPAAGGGRPMEIVVSDD